MVPRSLLIATGADSNHSHLVSDFITSFRAVYGYAYDVALIKFDEKIADKKIADNKIIDNFDHVYKGSFTGKNDPNKQGYFAAYHRIKTRLRDFFPGYDYYIWVDADCWFHVSGSIQRILQASDMAEIAIHPEYDVNYWRFPTPNSRTVMIYRKNEGKNFEAMPLNMPMLNAGVFGMKATSRLWDEWDKELKSIKNKYRNGEDVYFSDQICLHKLIYINNYQIASLRAIDNWQTYASIPHMFTMRDQGQIFLTAPTPPFEQIGIIHLAGEAKNVTFKTPNGMEAPLTYSGIQELEIKCGFKKARK